MNVADWEPEIQGRRPALVATSPKDPRVITKWCMREVFKDGRERHYEERDTHITMIFAADEVREWPKNIEITITETHN